MQQRIFQLLFLAFTLFPLAAWAQTYDAPVTVKAENSINTATQEYSPAFYENGLVFVSSNALAADKVADERTGKPTTSILWAKRGKDGQLQKPVLFAADLTSKYYDGPLTFDARAERVWLTRSNTHYGRPEPAADGKVKLKIYAAERKGNEWSKPKELLFNNSDYDCAHPSISMDGQRLYFASNRPRGFGGMDLYVCLWQNGKWSDPINMGPKVNTAKNEMFPFIHADGTLFFASNGYAGLGGLDLFYTRMSDTGWIHPQNLGAPVNSKMDDFGLIVDVDKKNGYFSSNRAGGKGDDDIYNFFAPNGLSNEAKATTQEKDLFEALVQVQSRDNYAPMPAVTITYSLMDSLQNAAILTDSAGSIASLKTNKGGEFTLNTIAQKSGTTDETGLLRLQLLPGRYLFNCSQVGYAPKYIVKTLFKNDAKVLALMDLAKSNNAVNGANGDSPQISQEAMIAASFGDEPNANGTIDGAEPALTDVIKVGAVIRLPNIYYHFNDPDIRPDGRQDLDALVDLMRRFELLRIEIAAHTDARGSSPYNQQLSQARANNLLEYIADKGIARNRMGAKGYGETVLKNRCADGINCNEAEHRQNRRVEIKILQTDPKVQTEYLSFKEQRDAARKVNVAPPKPVAATPPPSELANNTPQKTMSAEKPTESKVIVPIEKTEKTEKAAKPEKAEKAPKTPKNKPTPTAKVIEKPATKPIEKPVEKTVRPSDDFEESATEANNGNIANPAPTPQKAVETKPKIAPEIATPMIAEKPIETEQKPSTVAAPKVAKAPKTTPPTAKPKINQAPRKEAAIVDKPKEPKKQPEKKAEKPADTYPENQPTVEFEETPSVVKTEDKPIGTTPAPNADIAAAASNEPEVKAESMTLLIVIGTYNNPMNAKKQLQKAIDFGFVDAEIMQFQETKMYAVCIKKFRDRAEAKKFMDFVNQERDFDAFIREYK